jgi:hypothetical protein
VSKKYFGHAQGQQQRCGLPLSLDKYTAAALQSSKNDAGYSRRDPNMTQIGLPFAASAPAET